MSDAIAGDEATVTVFLLRHGRTELNASGRLRGRIDAPLDGLGREQAAALGRLFAGVPVAVVATSPLGRTWDTAAVVAESHPGIVPEADPDLADRDWGRWAGEPEAEVISRFGSLDAAPGVEAASAFATRARRAIERLAGRAGGRPVVAVAHDAVNRAVLAGLCGLDAAGIAQPTGCWNRLVSAGGIWSAPIIGALPGDGNVPLADGRPATGDPAGG